MNYSITEIGKLVTEASESTSIKFFEITRLYLPVWKDGINEIEPNIWDKLLEATLSRIQSKSFDKNLQRQADNDYEELKIYDKQIDKSNLALTHKYYNEIHRKRQK